MKSKAGNMSKTNEPKATAKKRLGKLGQNAVAILISLSMVWWQTPVYALADDASSSAASAKQEQQVQEPQESQEQQAQEQPSEPTAEQVPAASGQPSEEPAEEPAAEEPQGQPETGNTHPRRRREY